MDFLTGKLVLDNIYLIGCEPANNLVDSLADVTDYVMHDFWTY